MKKPISTPRNVAEYKAIENRASRLVGCCENSDEEAELEAIADAMDAYDTMARLAPLLNSPLIAAAYGIALVRLRGAPDIPTVLNAVGMARLGGRTLGHGSRSCHRTFLCARAVGRRPRLRVLASNKERFDEAAKSILRDEDKPSE